MTSVTVVETLIPTTPILGTQTKGEPTRSKETKIKKIPKKKRFREDDVSV